VNVEDLEGIGRALWAIEVPTHVFVTREPSPDPSVLPSEGLLSLDRAPVVRLDTDGEPM
jgi:hypothetical protein